MTKSEFIQILNNPSLMSKEQTFDLEDIVNDFPFFQAARVLYLKGLKSQNSFRYNQTLKTTAAYTTDRSILFKFITSEDFKNQVQQNNEKQFIDQLETVDEKVLENLYNSEGETVPKEPIIDGTDESNSSKIEEKEHLSQPIESENTKYFIPETASQDKAINQDEIDEIADAFLRKIEAENRSEEITETSHETEEELISSEVSEIEPTTVEDFENDENEEFEAPIFELEKETEIENLDEVKTETIDDEMIVFELLPNEIFEKTIQKDEPEEKVKISMDDDFSPPVQFHKSDTHSFTNWLKISSFKPIDRNIGSEKRVSLEEKLELIEDFIVKNPKIEPVKDKINTEPIKQYSTENEEIMTETLARLYVLQHKYSDAINAYQILSLKFPEKSSFFANQIKQIEVLRKNNFN